MLLVGLGVQDGQQYWVVRNSWAGAWDEGGYIRLERGSNPCGISTEAVGAMVAGSPAPAPSPDGWVAYSDVYSVSSQQIDVQHAMTVEDAKAHCAGLTGCAGFTVHATADATNSTNVYFENGLDTISAAGWTAFRNPEWAPSPTPVPVPPPPPPTPAPIPMPDRWVAHLEVYFHSSQQIDKQDSKTVQDAKEHATADETKFASVYFENGLDTVYAVGWTAFEKLTGPTPAPTPTPIPTPTPTPTPTPSPTPSPSLMCPSDADQLVGDDGRIACSWSNGAHGLMIAPSASDCCDCIGSGYFGCTWPTSDSDYECAASARKSSNGQTAFCVWTDGAQGITIPYASSADCGRLSEGRICLILPKTLFQIHV